MINGHALFDDDHMDEFLKFDRVVGAQRRSERPDLCACLLFDALVPAVPGKGTDIISAAEHDQFWFSVDVDAVFAVASEEDLVTLRRCGVCYDADFESFFMFT